MGKSTTIACNGAANASTIRVTFYDYIFLQNFFYEKITKTSKYLMIFYTFPQPIRKAIQDRIQRIAKASVKGDLTDDQADYELQYLLKQAVEAAFLLQKIEEILKSSK